jgi:hypothetical protein
MCSCGVTFGNRPYKCSFWNTGWCGREFRPGSDGRCISCGKTEEKHYHYHKAGHAVSGLCGFNFIEGESGLELFCRTDHGNSAKESLVGCCNCVKKSPPYPGFDDRCLNCKNRHVSSRFQSITYVFFSPRTDAPPPPLVCASLSSHAYEVPRNARAGMCYCTCVCA